MTSTTLPKLPDTVRVSNAGSDSGFRIPSRVSGGDGQHFIDQQNGRWMVYPAGIDRHLSVEDVREYMLELRQAVQTAEAMARHTPREVSPSDEYITAELDALFTDHGLFNYRDQADAIGWTRAKLLHRQHGHSSWCVGELRAIAIALHDDRDDAHEWFKRVINGALQAD